MILIRRPVTLFDVDLIGVLGLLGLGAAAGWLILQTSSASALLRQDQARLKNADPLRRAQLQTLNTLQQEIELLRANVAKRQAHAPGPASVSGLVGQIARAAHSAGLELLNVTPGPLVTQDGQLLCDIQVAGRGSSLSFLQFLFDMADSNPYQTLQAFSISRPVTPDGPACQINWTLRLHMLPPASPEPPNLQTPRTDTKTGTSA